MVTVDARPEPLELDVERTALIVVDMQNDFGSPGGMFDASGIEIGASSRSRATASCRSTATAASSRPSSTTCCAVSARST